MKRAMMLAVAAAGLGGCAVTSETPMFAVDQAAKQLHAERPLLVISVSAATALVVGLAAGFVIGRATADEY